MSYLQRRRYTLMSSRHFKGYVTNITGQSPLIPPPHCTNEYPISISVNGNAYQGNNADNCVDILDVWDNPTNATYWYQWRCKEIQLKPNTAYTLSTNAPVTMTTYEEPWATGLFMIFPGRQELTWLYSSYRAGVASDGSPTTWCTDENGYLTVWIRYAKGEINVTRDDLANGTYWVMLNEGETALEYKPYAALSSTNPRDIHICGDKTQNLFNVNDKYIGNATTHWIYATVDEDDWITVEYDNSNGTATAYVITRTNISNNLKIDTTYLIVVEIAELENCELDPTDAYLEEGQIRLWKNFSTTGTYIYSAVSASSFDDTYSMLRTVVNVSAGSIGKAKFRISVLPYDETITADNFVYERYNLYKIPMEQNGNLFNLKDLYGTGYKSFSVDSDDWISISVDNSAGESTAYRSYYTNASSCIKPNRLYTVVTEIKEINNCNLNSATNTTLYASIGQFKTSAGYKSSEVSAGVYKRTLVSRESNIASTTMLRTEVSTPAGNIGNVTFRISLFEGELSTAVEDFIYSPYAGGVQKFNIHVPQQLIGGEGADSTYVSDIVTLDVENKKATLIKNFNKYVADGTLASGGGYKFWNTQYYSYIKESVANFRFSENQISDAIRGGAILSNYFIRYLYTYNSMATEGCIAVYVSTTSLAYVDFAISHSTLEKYYPNESGEYGTEETIAEYNNIISSETVGEPASGTYMSTACKALNNYLIAQNEAGTPLTFYYQMSESVETDISDLQDWSNIPKLTRRNNSLSFETYVAPYSIDMKYYKDKYE